MAITIKTSERDFLNQVIDLAHYCGWKVAHFRPAMTSKGWVTPVQADAAGYPDLTLVKDGQIKWAELKMPGKWPTEAQCCWLRALAEVGDVYIWYPEDWSDIIKVLGIVACLK